MAWFRVRLTEEEQRVVNEERCCHPNLRIREKMLVLWLLHTGLTRQHAAKAVGVSRADRPAIRGRVSAGGLGRLAAVESQLLGERDGRLSRVDPAPPSRIKPATTIAEACERIFQLTGLRRGPSQVAKFLKDLGLKFYRLSCDPRAAKKKLGRARCRPSRFSRDETEAGPGRRPSR